MDSYEIASDPELKCENTDACTCDDSSEKLTVGIGFNSCRAKCLMSEACTVMFCAHDDATSCDCHEYASCSSTRTLDGLRATVHAASHLRKVSTNELKTKSQAVQELTDNIVAPEFTGKTIAIMVVILVVVSVLGSAPFLVVSYRRFMQDAQSSEDSSESQTSRPGISQNAA
jgi:hypothetical protein